MALSSLTSTIATNIKWTAQNNLTGSVYNPISNTGVISKQYSIGTSAGNTTTEGGDQLVSFQQSISSGSSASIDLRSLTNILAQSSTVLARVKGYQIRLLSAADDSTITPAPNAASTCTVTNLGLATPSQLDFNIATGGSGLTVALTVGGSGEITAVAIGAAGSGYLKSTTFLVVPAAAAGSGGTVAVTTNASGVPTSVAIGSAGTGYSAATVATVVGGQYSLLTGGAHMYFDVGANGFCITSATQKLFKVQNNDNSNAITVEIDLIGADS